MPRPNRITLGGYVYHVLNRANGRLKIFKKAGDFLAFEQILAEGIERFTMRICGYCIMSNHWGKLVRDHIDQKELDHLNNSINRGAPLGELNWARKTAVEMNIESTMNPRGRPRKGTAHL